uniref:E3 ubiquitin-protein ligase RNF128-like n=1 Tax=Halichoerus grypus TaxID=9711 RepID=UPI0016597389|nr:E3 ubiquitin-protein ligase RNF128-like [Halichoerus grypus]
MGPPPGAGVLCRGGCGFSRLLAWCFLLALSPHAPGSRGAEAVWTAYLNVSWRVPHTGVNRTVWELSEEGVYGQDSPLEPVAGVLVPPDGPGALNACNPHTNFTVPTVPGDWGSTVQVSWLALIQRGGGCTFADKIHLAYERGASGAVIFNFPGTRNEVIPMSHPGCLALAALVVGTGFEIMTGEKAA